MKRARVHGWGWAVAAGVCLTAALQGCDVLDDDGACKPELGGQRVVQATIAEGTAVESAKLRAYFWYGDRVTDERNFVLSEAMIDEQGGFRLVLPEPPTELVNLAEIPAHYADSTCITVSDFSVTKSNFVECSIFDAAGDYIYMLYQSNRSQVQIAMPLIFGYYVYYSGPVHIDGVLTTVGPGYYTPSGEWVAKPVVDRCRYDDVQFPKGWCLYYLESISMNETPDQLEREFAVHSETPANIDWHLFYRPDLEP